MDSLRINAVLIYLTASDEAIRKRVSSGAGKRPLIASAMHAGAVDILMAARRPLYEEAADITLDTTKLGIEAATGKIIERLGEYEGFCF
jgi:shikimate kinase